MFTVSSFIAAAMLKTLATEPGSFASTAEKLPDSLE